MIFRALGWQGIAGMIVAGALALLLVIQKVETRHWQRQSRQFEQLHRSSEAALVGTIANYRAAADRARAEDKAAAARVSAEQHRISERTANDFESRLAAARARAQRLRREDGAAATDPRAGGSTPMPDLAAPPGSAPPAPGQDGFSAADSLIATEQAIQLDELIRWVRRQHAVDPNAPPP